MGWRSVFLNKLAKLAEGRRLSSSPLSSKARKTQGILNRNGMDKKRVDVAVRNQKSISGRVWARMVHSMPTRKSPALDADVEAAARLV